jgi:hypothetical protein
MTHVEDFTKCESSVYERMSFGGVSGMIYEPRRTTLSIRVYRMDLRQNAADHEPVVAAFRRGDPNTADLLREHVLGYRGCAAVGPAGA